MLNRMAIGPTNELVPLNEPPMTGFVEESASSSTMALRLGSLVARLSGGVAVSLVSAGIGWLFGSKA